MSKTLKHLSNSYFEIRKIGKQLTIIYDDLFHKYNNYGENKMISKYMSLFHSAVLEIRRRNEKFNYPVTVTEFISKIEYMLIGLNILANEINRIQNEEI